MEEIHCRSFPICQQCFLKREKAKWEKIQNYLKDRPDFVLKTVSEQESYDSFVVENAKKLDPFQST